ncbi:MAG: hypothetical protein K0R63_8 [Rickettsiales bacterium]|jgi:hypothetical protein|nr:hypothetical protein [Rickettsiales bacterium]
MTAKKKPQRNEKVILTETPQYTWLPFMHELREGYRGESAYSSDLKTLQRQLDRWENEGGVISLSIPGPSHSLPQSVHWPDGAVFTLGHSTLPTRIKILPIPTGATAAFAAMPIICKSGSFRRRWRCNVPSALDRGGSEKRR